MGSLYLLGEYLGTPLFQFPPAEKVNILDTKELEFKIPTYVWIKSFGFSEEEIFEVERFIRNNKYLLITTAKEGE